MDSDKILVGLEKQKEKEMRKKEGITAKVRLVKSHVTADELNNMSKDILNKISLSQPDPKPPNFIRLQALHAIQS